MDQTLTELVRKCGDWC